MDPTNILYPPNRFAREEVSRRVDPTVRDFYREMDLADLIPAAEGQPHEPTTAAERLAEALAPNVVEICALRDEAEKFTERSVRAVERPLKVHRTLTWKTTWAGDYLRLHTRLCELTKAHTTMARAAKAWRIAPGLGDDDAALTAILNGLARTLNEVVALLDTAGRSRVGPKEAAA